MKQEANMEKRSAEWYRGAVAALRHAALPPVLLHRLNEYAEQLAAAEAREAGEREAMDYRWRQLEAINAGLLRQLGNIGIACKPANLKAPDGKEWTFTPSDEVVRQYWEYLSKHVMEAMASTPSEAGEPSAAEVIRVAKAALEMVRQYICTHHITYLDRTPDGDRLRAMKHEAREYVESGKHLEALATITAWEAGNVQG